MAFVNPMLASPMPKSLSADWRGWVAEEKYDGHRLVFERTESGSIGAWSRYGAHRDLPRHLKEAIRLLPVGTYDGEIIVPHSTSARVKAINDQATLRVMVFDVTNLLGRDVTGEPYHRRRAYLQEIFDRLYLEVFPVLQMAESKPVTSQEDVLRLFAEVTSRGGEGLILKRLDSRYAPGKRSRDFVKVKTIKSAVLRVIGYAAGRSGPQSTVVLETLDRKAKTKVKAKDQATLRELSREPMRFLGRLLRIEYQHLTEDGNFRHPRWDRWEDE